MEDSETLGQHQMQIYALRSTAVAARDFFREDAVPGSAAIVAKRELCALRRSVAAIERAKTKCAEVFSRIHLQALKI